ncbi:MAG: hypothetical protein KAS13_05010 [Candidatus Omnitrophica bacterium]|nr:hypothetical protein [Candidatus Omnitrophota bacterium]
MKADIQQQKLIDINYKFKFEDGAVKTFAIQLDDQTLNLVRETDSQNKPDWALMKSFRCEHCSLDREAHVYCPLALNIYDLLENFKDVVSYDKVDLRIETERRTYSNNVPVQNALSSLIGIYMVSNGCPVFEKLKPMVRYHLPFASPNETAYRMISMYLMAQLFRQDQGKDTDWKLEKLPEIFEAISKANRNVSRKLKALVQKDALLNAVIILSSRVDFMALCFDEVILKEIERDFKPYTD